MSSISALLKRSSRLERFRFSLNRFNALSSCFLAFPGGKSASTFLRKALVRRSLFVAMCFAGLSHAPAAHAASLASIVIDANSGEVLQENRADSPRYPASLTKMMTLYLLFEQIEAGKLGLKSSLSVSANAARQPPTKLGVKAGETIRVEDAIMSLITRSANDVSVVIAENIAGDVDSFARRMTSRARQIGMSHTLFRNPNGLPNPEQVTTARDMAILGRSLFERFPKYTHYFARQSFVFRGHVIKNHNKLLGKVEGVDGIKTGYTRAAGFNLVTSVRKNGRHMVAAVLGAPTRISRDVRMRDLIHEHRQELAARKTNYSVAARGKPGGASQTAEPVETASIQKLLAVPQPAPAQREVEPASSDNAEEEEDVSPPQTIAEVPSSAPAPAASPAVAQQIAALPPVRANVASPPWQVPASSVQSVQDLRQPSGSVLQWRTGAQPAGRETTGSVEARNQPKAAVKAATPAAEPSGWVVQIAAASSERDALHLLQEARETVGRTLSRAKPVTEAVAKGNTTLYRARFAGFADKTSADKACAALKRNDYSCVTLKL